MNQLEQFREQCAVELEKLDCAHGCGVGSEIAQKIRALPLPEVKQEPITWLRKDTLEKLMDRQDGTVGFSAVLFKKETEIHSVGLYLDTLDAEVLRKENEELKKELASYQRMFLDACGDLGLISEELGLDPNEGGAEPILDAIAALKGGAA